MAQLYFHCSSPDRVLPDMIGSRFDDLIDAHHQAVGLVRQLIATEGLDDWREWKLLVLDEDDEEVFELPFASVIGRLH
jgi:hypothetical protein